MSISTKNYGVTHDGRPVERIELTAGSTRAVVINLGARLLEMWVPDRDGVVADIVLGYPDVPAHEAGTAYFGATCGRFGNRIRRGRFELDGTVHRLTVNEGLNHLHGGTVGFDQHLWKVIDIQSNSVRMRLELPDGDQGFPGALVAEMQLTLGEGSLDIVMTATADRTTVINMVHHSYWNLAGASSGNVLEQELQIDSDFYTPVDDELLPTGEILSVAGTPFDFRRRTAIGKAIREVDHGGAGRSAPAGYAGYDHNWILRKAAGEMGPCVWARDPKSGRQMTLRTNEPAVQFYPAGYLSDEVIGKHGGSYAPFQGFTLETQRFPDGPNFAHFPSCKLSPGEVYEHVMEFRFTTD
jgi:aldose 1-epimerase